MGMYPFHAVVPLFSPKSICFLRLVELLCRRVHRLQTDMKSDTVPSLLVPAGCVLAGLMRPDRCRALASGLAAVVSTRLPSALYDISSPGAPRSASYISGRTPQGGPLSERGFPDGNSRQMRRPEGRRSWDMRLAHLGRASGGRAHRNCLSYSLVSRCRRKGTRGVGLGWKQAGPVPYSRISSRICQSRRSRSHPARLLRRNRLKST